MSRIRLILEPAAVEIRARYRAGETCLGLAREYGVPETTMRDFFRRVGIEMREQFKLEADQVTEMVRLRDAEGWTLREIGQQFGVTRQTVAVRLRRF